MLFNSIEFLIFFPIVTALYFMLPHKFRWGMLLAASCVFYMFFVPAYIFILALTIVVDYYAGILIEQTEKQSKKKLYLTISIIVTCLILFVFKYYNFFNDNFRALFNVLHWHYPIGALRILLPIGLSFHTFQSMAYIIEVYRGNQKAEKNFGIYSLYVMFYPQLVAGPIERPQNLLHQFHDKHFFNAVGASNGLRRIMWGIFKKVVIADRLAVYVNQVYANPSAHAGIPVIMAIIFFVFQIYCDFSGYSDIALGTAEVMGFKLMTNFKHPFISKNISEFWRRWHISLSTWFNDYLFTPLTTSTRYWGTFGICFSIFITFLISGLWHGAGWTFLIYGIIHGIALIYEILTRKRRKKWAKNLPAWFYGNISMVITFAYVGFSWIFFRARDIHNAFGVIKNSFRIHKLDFGISILGASEFALSIGLIVFLLTIEALERKMDLREILAKRPAALRWAFYYICIVAIQSLGVFGNQQFIYFQF